MSQKSQSKEDPSSQEATMTASELFLHQTNFEMSCFQLVGALPKIELTHSQKR